MTQSYCAGGGGAEEGEADGSTFSFTPPFLLLIYSATVSPPPSPNVRLLLKDSGKDIFYLTGNVLEKQKQVSVGTETVCFGQIVC